MRSSTLLSTALLCGISLAHFEVKYPDSIGFKDDDEGESPCGGFTPDLSKDKLVDFHVGGEAIALRSTHQQGNWLFRVTLNEKADGDWEQVFPIVQQSGLGDFCQPQVTVPEKYAGKKGWVNVVSSAVDGLLYQCIAANFVKGKADPPSDCKNATSVKAAFTDDDKLSALVGNGSKADSSSSGTATGTATSTGSAASSTTSDNAVAALQAWSANGVGMITLMTMAFAGGALLI
ncbi:uncharacterized protein BKA55DRAFT_684937 [Fusarium redolens]|uniref:Copper acquisition factor BIM1-like domain-containing protein n=1 Tax=Fusarium redolens TaxID=48865 RepID=A0A9P9KSE8_FUSRE|nr:uncharacterized protein BKA55DRAFT_684937 [Fusarium redolens]KAH7267662.1 hypothetical protein BKA55DRAFT_684937 [Fusarium redolens]